jgi:flagellar basal-body rod modification protein FlgD
MAIIANVNDGTLDYNYTDSSKKSTSSGTDLGYDQFLQLLCAEMQYQDPLEPTSNTDYVAQLATFSQLEATLSQTDTLESNTANNLVGKQIILKTEDSLGNTNYVEGKVDYVLYKDGDIYLSVNDGLYPLEDLDTVADEQYYDATILLQTFSSMVATLPETSNITTAYKGAVEQVRGVYDDMTSYQQNFVKESDLTTLKEVETKLQELLGSEENEADAFKEQLALVSSKEELSTEDMEKVTGLLNAYNHMTVYQKTYLGDEVTEQMNSLKTLV